MKRSARSGWYVVRWVDLALGIALAGALSPAQAAMLEVADCGALAASDPAARVRVVADLECPGGIVSLAKGGTLELGARALRGIAVHCVGNCRIVGPGTIDAGAS